LWKKSSLFWYIKLPAEGRLTERLLFTPTSTTEAFFSNEAFRVEFTVLQEESPRCLRWKHFNSMFHAFFDRPPLTQFWQAQDNAYVVSLVSTTFLPFNILPQTPRPQSLHVRIYKRQTRHIVDPLPLPVAINLPLRLHTPNLQRPPNSLALRAHNPRIRAPPPTPNPHLPASDQTRPLCEPVIRCFLRCTRRARISGWEAFGEYPLLLTLGFQRDVRCSCLKGRHHSQSGSGPRLSCRAERFVGCLVGRK
jgi:hypothetical protein